MRIKVPKHVLLILKIYTVTVVIFTLFRFGIFLNESDKIPSDVPLYTILQAFIMGIRFDVVIAGYILVLPYILLTIQSLLKNEIPRLKSILFYYIFILFLFSFFIGAADIPYFHQFYSRFSVTTFEWLDSPLFVVKMIAQEPRYWLYLIPFVIAVVFFFRILRTIFRTELRYAGTGSRLLTSSLSVLFLAVMLLGIRGRVDEKSPIRVGTAYFSNNAFLNQLGLNPVFTLLRSYLDSINELNSTIAFMEDSAAIAAVQQQLNIHDADAASPLRRVVFYDSSVSPRSNVVVVIMECMGASKMRRHGNPNNITPFLDSISSAGYYFENAYTSGTHTYNGIFSTLFSFPAIYRQHPMKGSTIIRYNGIPTVLRAHDYSTIYFTTHDGQFDNAEGFLRANDFETVIAKDDYPSEKAATTLGVPDDFMFEYSIPVLNELHSRKKPFFAAYMTASDHGPYYIPEYFTPKTSRIEHQIVEYADYALNKFITLASRQAWFRNTLFVFVADHGYFQDATYDVSLSYHHTPLIFYAPEIITSPKVFNTMATQMDIFPSIMEFLQLPYANQSLGMNLFKENRQYAYFNDDDKFSVIDSSWLLIVRDRQSPSLFKYRSADTHNYASQNPETVNRMKQYAESQLQVFQHTVTTKHRSMNTNH